jgi:uncharacterized protein
MFGRFLYKYSINILLLTFLVGALSVYVLPRLKTEVGFEQFVLDGAPDFIRYERFIEVMGSTDRSFILALHHEPTIFNAIFLEKLQKLKTAIDSMDGVSTTMTLLDLKKYDRLFPGYYHKRPYLQAAHPERFGKDSLLILQDYPLTQHFVTKDNKWTKLLFHVNDNLSLNSVDSLVGEIDLVVTNLALGKTHLIGRKYMESEFKKLMNSEFKTSIVLSLIFIVLILWLLHRSIAGVLLPVLCMAISLLMLYGYMAIFNRSLTILSNLFPTIIIIVGISHVIHISSKYGQESLLNQNRIIAIDKTIKEIGLTTLINMLTTAIGFLTLLLMGMKAMRSFGVDAAIGLVIAWINSVFLLPALLVRFDLSKSFSKPFEFNYWNYILGRINYLTTNYPKIIVASFGFVVFIAALGMTAINTNNFVLTSLPEDNRLKNDFEFFDKKLGGGRTLELIIEPQANYHVYDQPVIENISKLETYLEHELHLNQIISPSIAIKWLHSSSGRNNGWHLPSTPNDFKMYKQQLTLGDHMIPFAIADSSGTIGRLMGRIKDEGRKTMNNNVLAMQNWAVNNTDTSVVQFQITGSDYLTDIGHQRRLENTVTGFLLEILVVAFIIGLLYKSSLLVLITFIANIIPIIIVAGFMGYTGIELRGSNSIIFAIGYVIATDDTLHFINRYRLELRKGFGTKDAVSNALLYTGRALVMTSLILFGGFLILLHSSFGDIYYHGLLVSIIIAAALVTDLLLTPVLLNYFFKEKAEISEIKKIELIISKYIYEKP